MEAPLTVFVSSVMNRDVDDLRAERRAAIAAINQIAITRSWAFEHAPAAPGPMPDPYLNKVRDCDLFILILSRGVTEPVKSEYRQALYHRKPCFVFFRRGAHQSTELKEFVDELRGQVKYSEYERAEDLASQLREAVADHIIASYRKYGLALGEVERIKSLASAVTKVEELRATHEASTGVPETPGSIVGRQREIEALDTFLAGRTRTAIVHGPGGSGKTKLVLEFITQALRPAWEVTCLRPEARDLGAVRAVLEAGKEHLIVVDDATRCAWLGQLGSILLAPEHEGRLKAIITCRSGEIAFARSALDGRAGMATIEVEVPPLAQAEIVEILRSPPLQITNRQALSAIAHATRGNPLLAKLAARLLKEGVEWRELPAADNVLTRYLAQRIAEVVHSLARRGMSEAKINAYLRVLAALGGLQRRDASLRGAVAQICTLSVEEEDLLFSSLSSSGIARLSGPPGLEKLRLVPDILADQVLIRAYTGPDGMRRFQSEVFAPFLGHRPREIILSLAQAEVRADEPGAGALLDEVCEALAELVRHAGDPGDLNRQRRIVANLMNDLALFRPRWVLDTCAEILQGAAPPDSEWEEPHWGKVQISHRHVLHLLGEPLKRLADSGPQQFKPAFELLQQLSLREIPQPFQPHAPAVQRMERLIEFAPDRPFLRQMAALDCIEGWGREEPETVQQLACVLCQRLLSLEAVGSYVDPADPRKFVFQHGTVRPVTDVLGIRRRALSVLEALVRHSSHVHVRVMAVEALGHAIYLRPSTGGEEWEDIFRSELPVQMQLLASIGESESHPAVLLKIEEIALRLGRFVPDEALVEREALIGSLRSDDRYVFFAALVGHFDAVEREWSQREAELRQRVQGLSSGNRDEMLHRLNEIAEYTEGTHLLYGQVAAFAYWIGELRPALGVEMLELIVDQNMPFLAYAGFILRGIRGSDRALYDSLLSDWLKGPSPTRAGALAQNYEQSAFGLRAAMTQQDFQWIENLDPQCDDNQRARLVWALPALSELDRARAVRLWCEMIRRGGDAVARATAELLQRRSEHGGIALESADLIAIMHELLEVPDLDGMEEALRRLGETDPVALVEFLERRLDRMAEEHEAGRTDYRALPVALHLPADRIVGNPKCRDALRRVRNWLEGPPPYALLDAANLFANLAGGGGVGFFAGDISESGARMLQEWIDTGEPDKLWKVALLLRDFGDGERVYALGKQIVARGVPDATREWSAAMHTGDASPPALSRQRELLSGWLDDESELVKRFARQEIDNLDKELAWFESDESIGQ